MLEKLKFFCCKWYFVVSIKIDAPMLASFEIRNCHYEFISTDFEVEICSDKLTDFLCSGGSTLEKFVLPSLSTVVEASLKYVLDKDNKNLHSRESNGFRACTLLWGFSVIIRCLELSGSLIEATHAERSGLLSVFNKLIHLKVHLSKIDNDFNGALVNLLKRAPALELLTFTGMSFGSDDDNLEEIELLLPNFLSHLKVVKFETFGFCEANVHLVKFLLQRSLVLEELLIFSKYFKRVPRLKLRMSC